MRRDLTNTHVISISTWPAKRTEQRVLYSDFRKKTRLSSSKNNQVSKYQLVLIFLGPFQYPTGISALLSEKGIFPFHIAS